MKNKLSSDRQRRLEELQGWVWDTKIYQWDEAFRRFREYVERNGDARRPATYVVDGYPPPDR